MKKKQQREPMREDFDDPNSPYGPNWQRFADQEDREQKVFDAKMPGRVDRLLLELLGTKGYQTPGEAVSAIAGHVMARLAALESPALAAEFCRLLADQVEALENPQPPQPDELHDLALATPAGRA